MQFCIKMLHGGAGGGSVFFYTPGRWWGRRRFASLIPSGWRLTPIHKVMGDHASRGSTPVGAFLSRGSLCVIYFVPRKRSRQYRGCMLGHFVPKKRFSLHQMCVLHCSLYIIHYVSPRPRPVHTKTFFYARRGENVSCRA